MNDLKNESNIPESGSNANRPSGEIFSNPLESSYQDAISVPIDDGSQNTEVTDRSLAPESAEFEQPQQNPPSDQGSIPPPPFEENKKKKILFIALGAVFLILLLFVVIKIFFKPKSVPKNISLTYWGLWEGKEVVQPIINDYQRQHPNITIDYIKEDPKEYRERLQAAISRGQGPDIFRFHNTWVPMLSNELAPVPKNVYSDGEFTSSFFPIAASDLKVGGNFYGIPLEIDGLMFFYNEDILKNANVAVPSSWVDVQNAAGRLTVKENGRIVTSGLALGLTENVEHFSDVLGLMMLQNGVEINKSLFSCSDPSVKSCATEALSFYHRFAEPPNNVWDPTLENSVVAFARGRAAMMFGPSWEVDTIRAINQNLNFKTAKVPQLPCNSQNCPIINWATYWVEGVSSKSQNKDESWAFLKYLSSPEVMKKYYGLQIQGRQVLGEPYSRVELANTLHDNAYLAPLLEMAPKMKSFPLASRTSDGETGLNSRLIKYMQDAINSLSQGGSAESALQTADNGFKQVFSSFNITSPAQPIN